MGITVGAALKKAAIAILGNPKTLKKLLFAVLVVFVALLLPMVMVVCLFSGSFQVDSGELLRYVEANLTASDVELLQNVETTMMEIENAMIEAELSADVGAAQALYIMALYDFASQPGFVSRLVSCFEAEQTDAQLIANVNAAFGTEIPVQEFTDVMRNVRSRRIDTARYVDCGTKNNLDLVQWAISACNSGWGYVMGTFGQVLTVDLLEAKLAQLPDAIGPYEDYIRANYLGARTADCIGLIKGYSCLTRQQNCERLAENQQFRDKPDFSQEDCAVAAVAAYLDQSRSGGYGTGFAGRMRNLSKRVLCSRFLRPKYLALSFGFTLS